MTSPLPAATTPQRRHSIREDTGRYAKPASPHHRVVQSACDSAQITRARGFTPHRGTPAVRRAETT